MSSSEHYGARFADMHVSVVTSILPRNHIFAEPPF